MVKKLILCIFLGFLPMTAGYLVPPHDMTQWYQELVQSPLTPPPVTFGIVWPILYLIMGLALFFVVQTKRKSKTPYYWFAANFVLNSLWTPLFFGLALPTVALIDLAALLVVVYFMTLSFHKVRPLAGYLLIPYLIWSTFALYLNSFIVWAN